MVERAASAVDPESSRFSVEADPILLIWINVEWVSACKSLELLMPEIVQADHWLSEHKNLQDAQLKAMRWAPMH